MRTKENLIAHELIGLECRVVDSSDTSLHDIEGRVVQETTHTLIIETENGEKQIVKNNAVFEFTLPSGDEVRIDGGEIDMNPVERTKRLA